MSEARIWRRGGNRVIREIDRARLRSRSFSIVSNDCWGGTVYQYLGRPYQTPFIGMFVYGPCFQRLVGDLRRLLAAPLEFITTSRYAATGQLTTAVNYPLAMLAGEVELHFLHYPDEGSAARTWNRRLDRFDWDNVLVKISGGKDAVDDRVLAAVSNAPWTSLVLVPSEWDGQDDVVHVDRFTTDGKDLFYETIKHVDIVRWVDRREIKPPLLAPR